MNENRKYRWGMGNEIVELISTEGPTAFVVTQDGEQLYVRAADLRALGPLVQDRCDVRPGPRTM